MKAAG